MGARLVKQVLDQWAGLPDPAFRVLVRMALTARDDDPEPCYFGGWEALARTLGRTTLSKADERAVNRACSALREAGVFARTARGNRYATARYWLALDPTPRGL